MSKKIVLFLVLLFISMNIIALEISIDTNEDGKKDRWLVAELSKDWKKLDINKNDQADESCFYISDTKKIYFIMDEKFDYSKNGKPDVWIKNKKKGKTFNTEIKIDKDGDGKIDQFVFKENDILYMKKTDTDNDEIFESVEYYNEIGYKTKESIDSNKDGAMDDHYFYENNILQKEELDTNFDGKADVWVIFKYNKDNSTKECIIQRDNNLDGKVDEWHYSDEKRRIIRIEKDKDFDGQVDSIKNL